MKALSVKLGFAVFILSSLLITVTIGFADSDTSKAKVEVQFTYVMYLYHADGSQIEGNEFSFDVDLQQPDSIELTLNIHAITNFEVLVRLKNIDGNSSSVTPCSLMLSATASGKANTQPIEASSFPEPTGESLSLASALSGKNNANGEGETISIRFDLDQEMIQGLDGNATYTVVFEVLEL